MIWFFLTLCSAFFESLVNVLSKKGMEEIDEYIIAWSFFILSVPFLGVALWFFGLPEEIGKNFWWALIICSTLGALAMILYMKALKASEISLTVPMIAFTPLFILVTSPVIIGEFPNIFGFLGVVLIVLGAYSLNLKERSKGILGPIKALFSKMGPKIMLVAAMIWSITANFDKVGILNSSPIFWSFSVISLTAIILTPFAIGSVFKQKKALKKNYLLLLFIGIFSALTIIMQMVAVELTLVAYVIAIKRTGIIMTAVMGYFIFKEKNIKERLLGAGIMMIGIVFITMF